jgi:alpha-amylase
MKKLFTLFVLLNFFALSKAQDVIFQGFYWNNFPGDVTDAINGGVWWDSIATVAPALAASGYQTIWVPPPNKGFGNLWDVGYGIYDYYDFGEFNQKGSTRTRHGNKTQFESMVSTLKAQGIEVMIDAVLNHRGGGDGQQYYQPFASGQGYTYFNPASGRFPGDSTHFHPNFAHTSATGDYYERLFFEDLCYFNGVDQTPPPGGWYFGTPPFPGLGPVADSLIAWGRYLVDSVGVDAFRLDAVKHIEPYFLAKWLTETNDGTQPYAVGELFDYTQSVLSNYHSQVTTSPVNTVKAAEFSVFDFPMRLAIKDVLNDGAGTQNITDKLRYGSLVWNTGLTGFHTVNWIDNHDTDRIGFVGGTPPTCDLTYGGACLNFSTDSGHDPVTQDKEDMGYPFIMAAEGRPMVFWKDVFWYRLGDQIQWLMALRNRTAQGSSEHIDNLAPVWTGGSSRNDLFVLRRSGTGNGDGMLLGVNDHPTLQQDAWVNTPFSNKWLRDYSDAYLFNPNQAYNDSRANVPVMNRDYSWWAMTGLYPTPPGFPAAAFSMQAQPGGCPHYIVLRASDAANFVVGGSAIGIGDQIAVFNGSNQVVGIGRVGQGYGWDGIHDMIIEVLGPFPTDVNPVGGAANGMAVNNPFTFKVYDTSAAQIREITFSNYAPINTTINVDAVRPETPNRSGTVSFTTNALGNYIALGRSTLTAFSTANLGWEEEKEELEKLDDTFSVALMGNPVHHHFSLRIQGKELPYLQVNLIHVNGQMIKTWDFADQRAGEKMLHFELGDVAAGFYMLQLKSHGISEQLPLVKY